MTTTTTQTTTSAADSRDAYLLEVRTGSLIGKVLDWAVTREEGHIIRHDPMDFKGGSEGGYWIWDERNAGKPIYKKIGTDHSPSTDWKLGGELAHRHRININYCTDLQAGNRPFVWADMDGRRHHGYSEGHDQPLVAAMRCFLISRHGEVMRVPAALYRESVKQAQNVAEAECDIDTARPRG